MHFRQLVRLKPTGCELVAPDVPSKLGPTLLRPTRLISAIFRAAARRQSMFEKECVICAPQQL